MSGDVYHEEFNEQSTLHLILEGKDMAGVGGWFGSTDPFYQLLASVPTSSGGVLWQPVFTSEEVTGSLNPRWKKAQISLQDLCKGDINKPLRIKVVDWEPSEKHNPMGYFDTSVADLLKVSGDASKTAPLRDKVDGEEVDYGKLVVRLARIKTPRSTNLDKLSKHSRRSFKRSISIRSSKEDHKRDSKRHSRSDSNGTSVSRRSSKDGRRGSKRDSMRDSHSSTSMFSLHSRKSSKRDSMRDSTGSMFSRRSLKFVAPDFQFDHNDLLLLTLEGKDLVSVAGWFETTNPYFQVMVKGDNPNGGGSVWQNVYRSEHLDDSVNPVWKEAALMLYLLCGGDVDKSFRIFVHCHVDNNTSTPMGFFDTTVKGLLKASKDVDGTFPLKDDEGAEFGRIAVLHAQMPEDVSDCSISSASTLSMAHDLPDEIETQADESPTNKVQKGSTQEEDSAIETDFFDVPTRISETLTSMFGTEWSMFTEVDTDADNAPTKRVTEGDTSERERMEQYASQDAGEGFRQPNKPSEAAQEAAKEGSRMEASSSATRSRSSPQNDKSHFYVSSKLQDKLQASNKPMPVSRDSTNQSSSSPNSGLVDKSSDDKGDKSRFYVSSKLHDKLQASSQSVPESREKSSNDKSRFYVSSKLHGQLQAPNQPGARLNQSSSSPNGHLAEKSYSKNGDNDKSRFYVSAKLQGKAQASGEPGNKLNQSSSPPNAHLAEKTGSRQDDNDKSRFYVSSKLQDQLQAFSEHMPESRDSLASYSKSVKGLRKTMAHNVAPSAVRIRRSMSSSSKRSRSRSPQPPIRRSVTYHGHSKSVALEDEKAFKEQVDHAAQRSSLLGTVAPQQQDEGVFLPESQATTSLAVAERSDDTKVNATQLQDRSSRDSNELSSNVANSAISSTFGAADSSAGDAPGDQSEANQTSVTFDHEKKDEVHSKVPPRERGGQDQAPSPPSLDMSESTEDVFLPNNKVGSSSNPDHESDVFNLFDSLATTEGAHPNAVSGYPPGEGKARNAFGDDVGHVDGPSNAGVGTADQRSSEAANQRLLSFLGEQGAKIDDCDNENWQRREEPLQSPESASDDDRCSPNEGALSIRDDTCTRQQKQEGSYSVDPRNVASQKLDHPDADEKIMTEAFTTSNSSFLSELTGADGHTIPTTRTPRHGELTQILKVGNHGVRSSMDSATLHIRIAGKELANLGGWFGSTNAQFEIASAMENIGRLGPWQSVYISECVENSLDPEWKEADLNVGSLCSGDPNRNVRISIFDVINGEKRALIGSCFATVTQLMESVEKKTVFHVVSEDGTETGALVVKHARVEQRGANSMAQKNPVLVHQFQGKNLVVDKGWFAVTDVQYRIMASMDTRERAVIWRTVYSSEYVASNLSPVWRQAEIDLGLLCGGEYEKPIRVSLFDRDEGGKDRTVGFFDTTVSRLIGAVSGSGVGNDKGFVVASNGKNMGRLAVLRALVESPHDRTPMNDLSKEIGRTFASSNLTFDSGVTQPSKIDELSHARDALRMSLVKSEAEKEELHKMISELKANDPEDEQSELLQIESKRLVEQKVLLEKNAQEKKLLLDYSKSLAEKVSSLEEEIEDRDMLLASASKKMERILTEKKTMEVELALCVRRISEITESKNRQEEALIDAKALILSCNRDLGRAELKISELAAHKQNVESTEQEGRPNESTAMLEDRETGTPSNESSQQGSGLKTDGDDETSTKEEGSNLVSLKQPATGESNATTAQHGDAGSMVRQDANEGSEGDVNAQGEGSTAEAHAEATDDASREQAVETVAQESNASLTDEASRAAYETIATLTADKGVMTQMVAALEQRVEELEQETRDRFVADSRTTASSLARNSMLDRRTLEVSLAEAEFKVRSYAAAMLVEGRKLKGMLREKKAMTEKMANYKRVAEKNLLTVNEAKILLAQYKADRKLQQSQKADLTKDLAEMKTVADARQKELQDAHEKVKELEVSMDKKNELAVLAEKQIKTLEEEKVKVVSDMVELKHRESNAPAVDVSCKNAMVVESQAADVRSKQATSQERSTGSLAMPSTGNAVAGPKDPTDTAGASVGATLPWAVEREVLISRVKDLEAFYSQAMTQRNAAVSAKEMYEGFWKDAKDKMVLMQAKAKTGVRTGSGVLGGSRKPKREVFGVVRDSTTTGRSEEKPPLEAEQEPSKSNETGSNLWGDTAGPISPFGHINGLAKQSIESQQTKEEENKAPGAGIRRKISEEGLFRWAEMAKTPGGVDPQVFETSNEVKGPKNEREDYLFGSTTEPSTEMHETPDQSGAVFGVHLRRSVSEDGLFRWADKAKTMEPGGANHQLSKSSHEEYGSNHQSKEAGFFGTGIAKESHQLTDPNVTAFDNGIFIWAAKAKTDAVEAGIEDAKQKPAVGKSAIMMANEGGLSRWAKSVKALEEKWASTKGSEPVEQKSLTEEGGKTWSLNTKTKTQDILDLFESPNKAEVRKHLSELGCVKWATAIGAKVGKADDNRYNTFKKSDGDGRVPKPWSPGFKAGFKANETKQKVLESDDSPDKVALRHSLYDQGCVSWATGIRAKESKDDGFGEIKIVAGGHRWSNPGSKLPTSAHPPEAGGDLNSGEEKVSATEPEAKTEKAETNEKEKGTASTPTKMAPSSKGKRRRAPSRMGRRMPRKNGQRGRSGTRGRKNQLRSKSRSVSRSRSRSTSSRAGVRLDGLSPIAVQVNTIDKKQLRRSTYRVGRKKTASDIAKAQSISRAEARAAQDKQEDNTAEETGQDENPEVAVADQSEVSEISENPNVDETKDDGEQEEDGGTSWFGFMSRKNSSSDLDLDDKDDDDSQEEEAPSEEEDHKEAILPEAKDKNEEGKVEEVSEPKDKKRSSSSSWFSSILTPRRKSHKEPAIKKDEESDLPQLPVETKQEGDKGESLSPRKRKSSWFGMLSVSSKSLNTSSKSLMKAGGIESEDEKEEEKTEENVEEPKDETVEKMEEEHDSSADDNKPAYLPPSLSGSDHQAGSPPAELQTPKRRRRKVSRSRQNKNSKEGSKSPRRSRQQMKVDAKKKDTSVPKNDLTATAGKTV